MNERDSDGDRYRDGEKQRKKERGRERNTARESYTSSNLLILRTCVLLASPKMTEEQLNPR